MALGVANARRLDLYLEHKLGAGEARRPPLPSTTAPDENLLVRSRGSRRRGKRLGCVHKPGDPVRGGVPDRYHCAFVGTSAWPAAMAVAVWLVTYAWDLYPYTWTSRRTSPRCPR